MKFRWLALVLTITMIAAACGDDSSTTEEGSGQAPSTTAAGSGSSDGDGEGGDPDDDGDMDDDGDNPVDNNATGDDDDLGDIVGNPDLDPDDVGDLGDDIDDIVSLGDCVIETMGIGATAPENYQCRVLDNPVPGFDGFTMFSNDTDLEITFGSSSAAINPCVVADVCGNQTPVDIPGFSDAVQFDLAGITGGIFGTHDEYDVELGVFAVTLLTDDDVALVQQVASTLTLF